MEAPRKPAFEYPYRCIRCESGHDTAEEANDCCEPKREAIYKHTDATRGKYANTHTGDQDWKYTRARRLAKGLEGLGEVH